MLLSLTRNFFLTSQFHDIVSVPIFAGRKIRWPLGLVVAYFVLVAVVVVVVVAAAAAVSI